MEQNKHQKQVEFLWKLTSAISLSNKMCSWSNLRCTAGVELEGQTEGDRVWHRFDVCLAV